MRQEYEVIHKFRSQSDKEKAENLFKRLLEHKRHMQQLNTESEAKRENGGGGPLH